MKYNTTNLTLTLTDPSNTTLYTSLS